MTKLQFSNLKGTISGLKCIDKKQIGIENGKNFSSKKKKEFYIKKTGLIKRLKNSKRNLKNLANNKMTLLI